MSEQTVGTVLQHHADVIAGLQAGLLCCRAGHHTVDDRRRVRRHRGVVLGQAGRTVGLGLIERLAGEQGRAIVAKTPVTSRNGWWLIARTKIIDDAIAEAIADGCDRVLNLAAGLDTRPYRLNLPSAVQ